MSRLVLIVLPVLSACSLPVAHTLDAEYEGYHVRVMLESPTQEFTTVLPHERLAEVQMATDYAWEDVHGPTRDCVSQMYLYIPKDDETFEQYCKPQSGACISYAHGYAYDGPVVFLRPQHYARLDHPAVYGGVYVHEMLHALHHCAGGDGDPDHNAPGVWYDVKRLAYEYANIPFWDSYP